MPSAAPRATWRSRALAAATTVQTGTAATIGAMLVTHLAAPVVAAVAGPAAVDMANQTMLLGRVYYQHAFVEPVLVWGALSAHVIASLVRRALLPGRQLRSPKHWTWRTWHNAAGLALVPVLLVHVLTNRLAPASAHPAIAELSPSELDLSYVAWGFAHAPRLSTVLYTWLCLTGAVHAVGGLPKMAERIGRPKRARPMMGAAFVVAGLLLLGTWRIARDGIAGLAQPMQARFGASYRSVWPWSWGIASTM
ncbi:Hypothetical protein MSYG_4295 [Malassezia sympodialis ATCC 42132]|uniref:Mitochondrial adapter protein MCP1 transmembrane domain-containing protein n=1 Tax=Malassezia sympodialis (strain ATCC 42132) TaxID=1230383 RepID=A0A1M8ABZ3_MALS4|nr:Hypothetical protein MSYG_4295 [Malassezia sympodialis ATCC 42132]